METFADRLRWARQRRGLSQGKLARACGLSQSAISSYENGSRKSPKKLLNLAQVLGVNIYWLSRGEGQIEPEPSVHSPMSESAWPFPSIDSRQYWSLPLESRKMIEQTVSALIDGLLVAGNRPK